MDEDTLNSRRRETKQTKGSPSLLRIEAIHLGIDLVRSHAFAEPCTPVQTVDGHAAFYNGAAGMWTPSLRELQPETGLARSPAIW